MKTKLSSTNKHKYDTLYLEYVIKNMLLFKVDQLKVLYQKNYNYI